MIQFEVTGVALQVWGKEVILAAYYLVLATASLIQEAETQLGIFGVTKGESAPSASPALIRSSK